MEVKRTAIISPVKKKKKIRNEGLPRQISGYDSVNPMQGVGVRSLVRELDPTRHNKDLVCHN